MFRKIIIACTFLLTLVGTQLNTSAATQQAISVEILSPTQVRDYPGVETAVVARITNNSDYTISDILTYITMADLGKNWTVNLEDYSADKPEQITELKAGETIEVSLPIRFVYTSNYYLYVTVTSKQNADIYSSKAIPVEIMGNTKIDPTIVQVVSVGTPLLIVVLLLGKFRLDRRKYGFDSKEE